MVKEISELEVLSAIPPIDQLRTILETLKKEWMDIVGKYTENMPTNSVAELTTKLSKNEQSTATIINLINARGKYEQMTKKIIPAGDLMLDHEIKKIKN